jgi:4-alpha-glucanotransferase
MSALDHLAEMAGIEAGWWDFFGHYRSLSDDTKRAFLAAMGFAVADEGEVAASIASLEEAPWRHWLEPVTVLREGSSPLELTVTVPEPHEHDCVGWALEEEDGGVRHGQFRPSELPLVDERSVDGILRRRHRLSLPGPLPLGFHTIRLTMPDGLDESAALILGPHRVYAPTSMDGDGRLWGYATQLYALRSDRNWGIGDFSDLAALGRRAAAQGAATIGLNPLHALFANQPERFSPYSPSSRLFLDIAYLDVEAVPDFADSEEARRLVASPAFQARLAAVRKAPLIDYPEVGALKMAVLACCWKSFAAHHLADAGTAAPTPRGQAFREFQRISGHKAERFAIFDALQSAFLEEGKGYWRHWPAEYQDPEAPAVVAFALANRSRVEFFWYLQWLAEQQLAHAHEGCREAGMAVGIYRDLGVGIAEDGAEAWANRGLLCLGVSVGAPPDPLNLGGQDWGLVPFNPIALRQAAYKPFRAVLEANMTQAGALRLDHAMSLQRLYWVPRGARADEGGYVRYPMDDLFTVTALVSQRQRCLVIGEDLGTVPDGFRQRLEDRGMLGYRLLVFEQTDGRFKRPDEITAPALVSFGTHDLPSLAGWWKGIDIEARRLLSLYPDPSMGPREEEGRAEDRRRAVAALAGQGLLDPAFPTHPELSTEQLRQLALALYAYAGRSPAKLLMVQFEDVLGLCMQMNLPGTVDQHANWRYRYPMGIDAMLADTGLAAVAALLADRRGKG